MEQTANEFLKLFRERLKYPIITVYSIILILYNWDVLAIFFLSEKSIEDRITHINTTYQGQTAGRILWPLAKAIIVSIIAPAIMLLLEYVQKFVNKPRQDIKDKKMIRFWTTKGEIATLEYLYEDSRTGRKKIYEWESKISELEYQLQKRKLESDGHIEVLEENKKSLELTIQNQMEVILKTNDNFLKLQSDLASSHKTTAYYSKMTDKFIELIDAELGINRFALYEILRHYSVDGVKDEGIILSTLSGLGYNFDSALYRTNIIDKLNKFKVLEFRNSIIQLTDFGKDLDTHAILF